jgi:predicted TIM-barrel fold metal-dependent hydrolase
MIERCGADRFLWASDFPHFDASPEPVKEVKEAVAALPPSIQQKILGDNAAEAYQLS